MQYPLIHMNGTNGGDLLEAQCEVSAAVRNALEVLCKHGPNARDYYPLGNAAWTPALNEHVSRVQKLRDVLHESEKLAEYLASDPFEQLEMRKKEGQS